MTIQQNLQQLQQQVSKPHPRNKLAYLRYWREEVPKSQQKTWRELAKVYGQDHSTIYRWYKGRDLIPTPIHQQPAPPLPAQKDMAAFSVPDRKKSHKLSPQFSSSSSSPPSPSLGSDSFSPPGPGIPRYSVDQFPTLPKYGKLPPTGYISNLSDDDWIVKYCGPEFSWVLPYLTKLRTYIKKTVRGIAYLPRGHGKTLSVIGLFSREILEVRKPILMIVSGPSAQRKIFRAFRRILTSEAIRRDYGDLFRSFSIITCELQLIPELQTHIDAAFRVASRGADVIGSHPWRLHFEDIVQEEFKSDESNEGLRDWTLEVIEYCLTPESLFTATGTRKGVDDYYSWMVGALNFDVLHNKAITLTSGRWPDYSDFVKETYDDGSGLLRERIVDLDISCGTYESLGCPKWPIAGIGGLLFKRTHPETSGSFESQMQNNPLPSMGLYFDAKDFIVINHKKYNLNDYKDFYVFIDPAYGTSKKADNTSIMVFCVMPPKLIIVDGIIDHLTWNEIEYWLERYITKYNPHVVYVEENFSQIWISQNTKAMAWPIMGIKQGKNKIMRIAATKVHWIEHRIEILDTYPGREKLYNEYVLFDETPSTSSKHDDGLDTVAMGTEHLAQYVRSEGISWFN